MNISPNGLTPSVLSKSPQAHAYGSNQLLLPAIIFSPSEVKIQRAKSIKLKSKVGMARGPVLYRQKQSSRVLRPNWNAVGLSWVFGINMTSRASPKWWGRRRHLHWTHRGIPLRMAENYASYIYFASYWQRGLLRRRRTEQKTTNNKLPVLLLLFYARTVYYNSPSIFCWSVRKAVTFVICVKILHWVVILLRFFLRMQTALPYNVGARQRWGTILNQ